MSRASEQEIKHWVHQVLDKIGIINNHEIIISGNSEKGDGYLGDITFVEARGENGINEEKTYNFVIKSGKISSELREIMPVRIAFENEIYFYNQILPEFVQFQKEKKIQQPFCNVPKCFATMVFDDMEVLILDNIKKNDYYLWDRTKPMNQEHIREVVKIYGKYHAISFALRDQKPEVFKKLTENLTDVFKKITDAVKSPTEQNLFGDIMNLAKENNFIDIFEKAKQLQKEAPNMNDLTDPSDPYAVILHGDCWNNNFMFKYKDAEKTKLENVCLLDFQMCRLASPIYDLSYFIFTCIAEDDVKNFDEIIDIYYSSFCDFCRQFGSDPLTLFPLEQVWDQWQKYSKFGLFLMPSIARICLSEEDEVTDITQAAESGVNIADAFTYSVKMMGDYEKRTLPIMRLAIDKKFI